MSAQAFRSGAEVVTEKLPEGAYDRLSKTILSLGRVVVPDELASPLGGIEIAAAPHSANGLILELYFACGAGGTAANPAIVRSGAAISEVEPYSGLEDADLWRWKWYSLNAAERSVAFARGVSIVSSRSTITIGSDNLDIEHDETLAQDPTLVGLERIAEEGADDDYREFVSDLDKFYVGLTLV